MKWQWTQKPSMLLSLSFEFSGWPHADHLPQDHVQAMQRAAKDLNHIFPQDESKKKDGSEDQTNPSVTFSIEVITDHPTKTQPNNRMANHSKGLSNFHNYPGAFENNAKSDIVLQFFYPPNCSDVLGIRIKVNLFKIDGVSGVRLALRTMEYLEWDLQKLSSLQQNNSNPPQPLAKECFKKNPHYHFGFRQFCNLIYHLGSIFWGLITASITCNFIKINPQRDIINSTDRFYAYYNQKKQSDPTAEFRIYSSEDLDFKSFTRLVESWRQKINIHSYFYLMNFAPHGVVPGTCTSADILFNDGPSMQKRYSHAILPVALPPPPPAWVIENVHMPYRLFFNNYGRYRLESPTAVLRSFVWDWGGLPGPLHGAGGISVNGRFVGWTRGLRRAQEEFGRGYQDCIVWDLELPFSVFDCVVKVFGAKGHISEADGYEEEYEEDEYLEQRRAEAP
eukprot:Nk52_evm1s2369 gene=Nk52_evmTU1s2369